MNRNALRIALACGAMLALAACGGGDDPMVTLPDSGPAVDGGGGGGTDSGTTPRRDAGPMMMDCTREADFEACFTCTCDADMPGCAAANTAIIENFYCGTACMSDCASFCADPSAMPPAACTTCANGIMAGDPDQMAFQADCSADPNCVRFVTAVQMCPM